MNKQNIIEAILKEDNLNNVIEAISLLRQGLNEYSSSKFACSVMWTVLRSGRISEKQAAVIAKECEKVGVSFLWSVLDKASCVALGIELPEPPAQETEAQETEAEETADLYEVEIKRGRSSLYKKGNMSAEEAAEVIETYLAVDKTFKVKVKKDGELIDYQPLLVANAKEQTAEAETEAEETEEGLIKVEDGVKHYPCERFDLLVKDEEGRIRRDEKDIDWEEMVDWLCTYEYEREGKYSFQLTYAYDDELLDYRDFMPERAALGLEEVVDA